MIHSHNDSLSVVNVSFFYPLKAASELLIRELQPVQRMDACSFLMLISYSAKKKIATGAFTAYSGGGCLREPLGIRTYMYTPSLKLGLT